MSRYREWVRRLTLKQYILFTAVLTFAVGAVVGAVTSPFLGPFSWSGVAVLAVLLTAFQVWWRQGSIPPDGEYLESQVDDSTES